MRKVSGAWIIAVTAAGVLALLPGCAANVSAVDVPLSVATGTSTPTHAAIEWPAGADANTPACQDASAAPLAIVNDALHAVSVEHGAVETTLPWLSARPDPDLGVWTLTGLVQNEQTALGTEGGYFVVWATRSDPTVDTFDGQIYTVSGVATQLTQLDPLLPAYVGSSYGEDAPPAALKCGTQRSNTP